MAAEGVEHLAGEFGEQFAQFAFDGVGLGIQKPVQVRFVCGPHFIGVWAGTESCKSSAYPRCEDEQRGGNDEGAEHEEKKLVHELMIPQRGVCKERWSEASGC